MHEFPDSFYLMNLLYFTSSYPFGLGEQWKANELKILVNHFENIKLVPYSYGGNADQPKPLPGGIALAGPVFPTDKMQVSKWDFFKILVHRRSGKFFKEFFARKVYRKRIWFISWLIATKEIMGLLSSKVLQQVFSEAGDQAVLYFYWGKGTCQVLPFIDTSRFHKIFVRMHRYDLFENENNHYIPYRGPLLDAISITAPSSIAGKKELKALYPLAKSVVEVVRCGTVGNGKLSAPSQDGVLRIVSCSLLSPVKRVHLMVESLQYMNFPVIWRHIGDGTLREQLEVLVKQLGLEDKFIFEGMMDSRAVLDFYTGNRFDLFINTSASEGVPFSIMEAFSVGIPVMATDVGGTGEMVDDRTGRILPADITPQRLAVRSAVLSSPIRGKATDA